MNVLHLLFPALVLGTHFYSPVTWRSLVYDHKSTAFQVWGCVITSRHACLNSCFFLKSWNIQTLNFKINVQTLYYTCEDTYYEFQSKCRYNSLTLRVPKNISDTQTVICYHSSCGCLFFFFHQNMMQYLFLTFTAV